jgi:hypothetical protein
VREKTLRKESLRVGDGEEKEGHDDGVPGLQLDRLRRRNSDDCRVYPPLASGPLLSASHRYVNATILGFDFAKYLSSSFVT